MCKIKKTMTKNEKLNWASIKVCLNQLLKYAILF